MMANDLQERNIIWGPEADIISDLPDDIIETILMYLPTRDAARTCILSSKWRYRWAQLPQLILDHTMLQQQSMQKQHDGRVKFAMVICQILILRQEPMIRFSLNIPELKTRPELDTLIYFVSRKGVKQFTLWMSNGFNKLFELRLDNVCISDELLDCLISQCTSMETLGLQTSSILGYLDIKAAPELKNLAIHSVVSSQGKSKSLIEALKELPALECLEIDYRFLKYMAAGGFTTRLPTPLSNLKTLIILSVCLDEVDLLSTTLCLIRGSPNLKTIEITVHKHVIGNYRSSVMEYLNFEEYSDVRFNLLEVKLQSFTGTKCEMQLIKLLLAKSPILKKIMIQFITKDLDDEGYSVLREFALFRRPSVTEVKISRVSR